MAKQLVSDELWAVIEPLLPVKAEKPRGGHPRIPNRLAFRQPVWLGALRLNPFASCPLCPSCLILCLVLPGLPGGKLTALSLCRSLGEER